MSPVSAPARAQGAGALQPRRSFGIKTGRSAGRTPFPEPASPWYTPNALPSPEGDQVLLLPSPVREPCRAPYDNARGAAKQASLIPTKTPSLSGVSEVSPLRTLTRDTQHATYRHWWPSHSRLKPWSAMPSRTSRWSFPSSRWKPVSTSRSCLSWMVTRTLKAESIC